MEYKILTAKNQQDLMVAVNEALKDGWKLQGGIALTNKGGVGMAFAQAVIK